MLKDPYLQGPGTPSSMRIEGCVLSASYCTLVWRVVYTLIYVSVTCQFVSVMLIVQRVWNFSLRLLNSYVVLQLTSTFYNIKSTSLYVLLSSQHPETKLWLVWIHNFILKFRIWPKLRVWKIMRCSHLDL